MTSAERSRKSMKSDQQLESTCPRGAQRAVRRSRAPLASLKVDKMIASRSALISLLMALTLYSSTSSTWLAQVAGSQPSSAVQSVLLDTTEHSVLGWTKYPDAPQARTPGWSEESFLNLARGINWRSFVVCDIGFNSVNNWLWTPYLDRADANRLYIEMKFTMRDCNLFPNVVLSCKETFALLYKETDAPVYAADSLSASNASFAQSDSYNLIDAIAADNGRFTSDQDVVTNTEIRSIPVSKRGVYFAFRDQGACISLISIRVYHLKCPQLVTNFAHFNATPTGRDLTSLVAVEGRCVANSVQIEQPKLFCTADGQWNSMSSGQCKCLAGFEPAANQTRCQACPAGKFKSSLGELPCQQCPERSSSLQPGSSECKCHEAFFRAPRDAKSAPCTQPPSAPTSLQASQLDATTFVLEWSAPRYTGGRDDLTYRLVCDQCTSEQTSSLVSSPALFYANLSETKCVLSGLQANSQYKFLVYALNGVSQQALAASGGPQQHQQFSEITVQTGKQPLQSTSNTLSAQGGFQLLPIYNFRAIPGARGSDMILAWEAQSQPELALAEDQAASLPSLYEIRYQARQPAAGQDHLGRSPYPSSLISQLDASQGANREAQPQTLATTNRALVINSLQPRSEYAFQIRAKWAQSGQWSEFSEPIYATTGSQMPPVGADYSGAELVQPFELARPPYLSSAPSVLGNQQTTGGAQATSGWLSSLAFVLACLLIALALISLASLHYRKSPFVQSLGLAFGPGAGPGGAGAYGAVYGTGTGSDLLGAFASNSASPLAAHPHLQHQMHQAQHLHTHLAHPGLMAPANGAATPSSRSSSGGGGGAASAVQNFIAATLGHISGAGSAHGKMMGAPDGKRLFSGATQPMAITPRNHYHQTLSPQANHALLLSANQAAGQVHQQQQQLGHDLLKYRTLSQPGEQLVHQLDPQLHIYDDLDTTTSSPTGQQRQQAASKEIEPHRLSVESVIGRGEFGDVCLGRLRCLITGAELRVAVKKLKAQAGDRAKLDLLVEASIMSKFEHPNIVHLEGVVSKSEPPMIVVEFMENGSLDAYLRDNKNRFTCLQLISMLRGIANGMQYLAKLNYVHKDLAARNVLVNEQNVCKIADFGLSVNQAVSEQTGDMLDCYVTNESSSSSASSNTLSTSGSAANSANSQLVHLADQLAQQRFVQVHQQQHQLNQLNQLNHTPSAMQIQNPKIPVRWTALEAIAFRRFTSASDVWSFGIVCWEVMTQGEKPYWNWSNQDVIKAIEQGYRLPQPEACPGQLYKLMLDCWLKDRAARPSFTQIVRQLERLLSPYDDPFCQPSGDGSGELGAPEPGMGSAKGSGSSNSRIAQSQEANFYDTYNHMSQLAGCKQAASQQQSVDDWLDSIKMSKYKENFRINQINTLQSVARLNQVNLNLIGVSNGSHLRKLLNAIGSLRSSASIGASGEGYLV